MRDLGQEWKSIEEELRPFTIFPSVPSDSSGAVFWPDEDWRAFLGIAAKLGVQVVYVETQDGRDAIEHFVEEWIEDDVLGDADARVGELGRVELAFNFAGVWHLWHAEADWVADLRRSIEDLESGRHDETARGQQVVQEHLVRLRGRSSEWVELLLRDARFLGAGGSNERREIARAVVPEFRDVKWSFDDDATPEETALRYMAREVVEAARNGVKDRRETVLREATKNIAELALEVQSLPEFPALTNKAGRRPVIRRFLVERLGFSDPSLVELLLQRATDDR